VVVSALSLAQQQVSTRETAKDISFDNQMDNQKAVAIYNGIRYNPSQS